MAEIQFEAIVNQEQVIRPPDGVALPQGRVEVRIRSAAGDEDDLNWQDLDYVPIPLKATRKLSAQVQHRGKLLPMRHDLDEE